LGTTAAIIEEKVRKRFQPTHLEVINESSMHNVEPGSESHFRLVIVSQEFEGMGLVERHRAVNGILAHEIENTIHALALETRTPQEWEARNKTKVESPPCLGGDKQRP